jgi:hypothetical protein
VSVLVACGCSSSHASRRSSTAPPGRSTTVRLESSSTQRGVTVTLRRVVFHTNGQPEVFIDFANRRHADQPLELVSDRVVATQGGTRIVARGTGGGATALVLTGGASSSGWSVVLPGLRPGQRYALTATVTVADEEIAPWKLDPIRFRFGFAPA